MSDTASQPRVGYAITWTPFANGHVRCWHWQHAAEGQPGWYPTEREAREATAREMSVLVERLQREAWDLLDDRRRGR